MMPRSLSLSSRPRLLVTGATGFIGSAVVARSRQDDLDVTGIVRPGRAAPAQCMEGPSLGPAADWSPLLRDIDVVVHTAARVHMMREDHASAFDEHARVNTEGTLALAKQAAAAGVKRFIFLSTIKVMGEQSSRPFRADDRPEASDAYALSKLAAEKGLAEIGRTTGMEWVIIRPPLVYGPGVGGNFATMMRWIRKGVPLPLGAIRNKRSLVARDNLVDLISLCVEHPDAANQVLLVSDGVDVSTPELVRRLASAMSLSPRLFSVPASLLMAAGQMLGRRKMLERLCGDLQVDIAPTIARLGWRPPMSVDEGLRRAVQGRA